MWKLVKPISYHQQGRTTTLSYRQQREREKEGIDQFLRFLVDYSVESTTEGLIDDLWLTISLYIIGAWLQMMNSTTFKQFLHMHFNLQKAINRKQALGMSNWQMMLPQMLHYNSCIGSFQSYCLDLLSNTFSCSRILRWPWDSGLKGPIKSNTHI